MAQIVDAVARRYGVRPSAILSDRRNPDLVRLRWIVMHLAAELTYCSLSTIARYMRRDHTTVAHGIGRMRELMLRDDDVRAHVEALLRQIEGGGCGNAALGPAQGDIR